MKNRYYEKLLILLSPFAPHIAEELWEVIGEKGFIAEKNWPARNAERIDNEAEAAVELAESTKKDIVRVIELAKVKPTEITLFIADEWKYEFYKNLKEKLEETREIGELMKSLMVKGHEEEVRKLIPRIVKTPQIIPETMLEQGMELEILKEENKADNAYSSGDAPEAVRVIQGILDKHVSAEVEKGWYLQEMARFSYAYSRSESNALQVAAHKANPYLLRPQNGMADRNISRINLNRISNIVKNIKKTICLASRHANGLEKPYLPAFSNSACK